MNRPCADGFAVDSCTVDRIRAARWRTRGWCRTGSSVAVEVEVPLNTDARGAGRAVCSKKMPVFMLCAPLQLRQVAREVDSVLLALNGRSGCSTPNDARCSAVPPAT